MKITASRMRPTRAARGCAFGFIVMAPVVVQLRSNTRTSALRPFSMRTLLSAPKLHGVSRAQRLAVHFRLAAHEVHVEAAARGPLELDDFRGIHDRRVEGR